MKPASTEQRFKPAFELIHHVTLHQLNGENWNLLFYLSIQSHFADNKQMAIVSGPRQVGKTTLAQTMRQSSDTVYFNWDDFSDRELSLKGGQAIANGYLQERWR